MSYAKLDSVLDQCPCPDALIVVVYFNPVIGTERAGYELCVGHHAFGTRNENTPFNQNFERSRRLRIVDSWYQRQVLHRLDYRTAGEVAKEIEYFVFSTRWRILQNCRVYRSNDFFAIDHGLVANSRKPPRPHCVSSYETEGFDMYSGVCRDSFNSVWSVHRP